MEGESWGRGAAGHGPIGIYRGERGERDAGKVIGEAQGEGSRIAGLDGRLGVGRERVFVDYRGGLAGSGNGGGGGEREKKGEGGEGEGEGLHGGKRKDGALFRRSYVCDLDP